MTYQHYVALGSSYAAGPGLRPVADRTAGRSKRNYAHLVAGALGAQLTDATVAGATTATILHTGQRTLLRTRPPQVQAVHGDTDLVTVTAGGNDLGYIGTAIGTAVRNKLLDARIARPVGRRLRPARPLVRPSADQVAAAAQGLVDIVAEVGRRAPRARVVLVDYLPLFDEVPPPYPAAFLRPEQVQHLRLVAQALSEAFTAAAARSGAELVSADAYGSGHGVGSPVPWVSGLSLRHLPGSFHPTAAGMRVVADTLLARL